MADEPYDALYFKMVNGETHVKTVPPGQGPQVLVSATEWIEIDDGLHVRASNVVSVRLIENAQDSGPGIAFG